MGSCNNKKRLLKAREIWINCGLWFIMMYHYWLFFFFSWLCRLFSCRMWDYSSTRTLSCGMQNLVPWPGIQPRPPALGAQSQPLGCQGSPSIGCLIVTKGPFIYKMLIQETECEVHMNSLIHLFHFSVNLKLFKYFKFIKILFLKITSTIIPFCGGSKKKR